MTNIYLIRHAHAEEKKETHKAGLTDFGIKQAKKLAERLRNLQIHVTYASSYLRGRLTAEIIMQHHDVKAFETMDELVEVDFRVKKRLSLDTFSELKNFYSQNEVDQINNLLKAQKRALTLLRYLFSKHNNQNVLIVTHGNVIKAMILGIMDFKLSGFQKIQISETSITKIVGTDLKDAKIHSINDASHLESLNRKV